MRVVVLDPGETTGYAVYDTKAECVLSSGELFGNFRGCVEHVLGLGDFFIVESFRVRPGKGAALARLSRLWPVEWMGALRYVLPTHRLHFQTPAQGKGVQPLRPGFSPHEEDALSHLNRWLGGRMLTPERLKATLLAMTE